MSHMNYEKHANALQMSEADEDFNSHWDADANESGISSYLF